MYVIVALRGRDGVADWVGGVVDVLYLSGGVDEEAEGGEVVRVDCVGGEGVVMTTEHCVGAVWLV